MKERPLTKKQIIDLIVASAQPPHAPVTGDSRDGNVPPITVQNFINEMPRYAAKALRKRLSLLPLTELLNEGIAALDYVEAQEQRLQGYVAEADRREREEAARALRQRQAELGRRPRLQPAILAAARYYRGRQIRGRKMYAEDAWREIQKEPYQTSDGEIVMIEGDELRVQSRARTQRRSPIKFAQWQKRYWAAAKRNSP